MPMIETALIAEAENARRMNVSAEDDAALLDSVRALGVLQPIVVTPTGNGFAVVLGHRRLRAAREAGLTEIPAEVREIPAAAAIVDQTAENLVRTPMHPLDQWRAIVRMQESGLTLTHAAHALGISERRDALLDRLGRLHPSILALIEAHGLPEEGALRQLLAAPHAMQAKSAKSAKSIGAMLRHGDKRAWGQVAALCKVTRILRDDAIFDTALCAWDEDLFAEPGSRGQFSTADVDGFRKYQKEALEKRIAEQRAASKRARLASYDERAGGVALPKGLARAFGDAEKPKRNETVFHAIRPDGSIACVLAKPTLTTVAEEATPSPEDGGLARTALTLVAEAKTRAPRETLRTGLAEMPIERLLALMVLTLTAENVEVHNADTLGDFEWSRRKFRDLAAALLLPGGDVAEISAADARAHAGEVLARILSVGAPDARETTYGRGSGDAAEWIGAAIGADHALPRFDTPEFLAGVTGASLRAAAEQAGIKAADSVKALREQLAGHLPGWRPDHAAFGAPAPVLDPLAAREPLEAADG